MWLDRGEAFCLEIREQLGLWMCVCVCVWKFVSKCRSRSVKVLLEGKRGIWRNRCIFISWER